jgi:hypothetical protein
MALKSREKILIGLAVVAIAVWMFDRFYYTPQDRKIKKLKADVKAADLKLDGFLTLGKGMENLEAEVLRQEGELKRLSERTLKGEEFRAFLKHLAKESDPLQMKVISLNPQEEKVVSSDGKKEGTPSQFRKVSVQMVLHATYSKLGAYLKGIEELPCLIHLDNVHIEKDEEVQSLLKVTLGLSIYITPK